MFKLFLPLFLLFTLVYFNESEVLSLESSSSDILTLNDELKVKKCKHGYFLLSNYDVYLSKQLDFYGEWAEGEIQLFLQLVRPGDIVIDAGANIGAFTVPLSQAVGRSGEVHTFEPQRVIYQRLVANVAMNGLDNVFVFQQALGSNESVVAVPRINYTSPANFAAVSLADVEGELEAAHAEGINYAVEHMSFVTLDGMHLARCPSLIKMDLEPMELAAIEGGAKLMARCSPLLFVENNCIQTSAALVEKLFAIGYNLFWVITPDFRPENHAQQTEDITEQGYSINMLCVPQQRLARNGGNIDISSEYEELRRDAPYLHQYYQQQQSDGSTRSMYVQFGNLTYCRSSYFS